MPEPPVSPGAPPPIRDDDPVSGRVLTVDSPRPRSSIRVDDPVSGGPVSGIGSRPSGPGPRPIDHPRLGRGLPLPLQAIDPPRLEPRPRSSTPIDDPRPGRSRDIGSRPSGPGPRPSIRVHDSGSGHLSAIDPRPGPLPLPAINSRRPAPRPRLSIGDHDPGSRRVGNINSLPPAPRPRPSIRVDDPGSGRVRAVNARRPASRPRPLIRVDDGPGALGSCKPSAAPNKEAEEAQYEIQRLNELRLGEDISYEESRRYLGQLPHKTDVDTSTKLDATRHALYRSKYYQLSYQVPEDYRPSRLEERGFSNSYEDGKLDWYFHPDYCKLAGLEDY